MLLDAAEEDQGLRPITLLMTTRNRTLRRSLVCSSLCSPPTDGREYEDTIFIWHWERVPVGLVPLFLRLHANTHRGGCAGDVLLLTAPSEKQQLASRPSSTDGLGDRPRICIDSGGGQGGIRGWEVLAVIHRPAQPAHSGQDQDQPPPRRYVQARYHSINHLSSNHEPEDQPTVMKSVLEWSEPRAKRDDGHGEPVACLT